VAYQGLAYFIVHNGQAGEELWVSDGSEAGTTRIYVLAPVDPDSSSWWELVPYGGRIIIWGNPTVQNAEPWISDGTEAGTRMIKDICPGPVSSAPQLLAVAPEGVYFAAFDFEAGYELWRTDGSEAGTLRVADLWPGPEGSVPHDMIRLDDGRLIFAARTPGEGSEVWETDGTAAHTQKAAVVMPGSDSAYPRNFVQAGSLVLFQATDGVHGFEVWALPAEAAGSVPDGESASGGPLHLTRGDETVTLSWGSSCYYRDKDYAVYSGTLGAWGEITPLTCTTDGAAHLTVPLEVGDAFFLVVPRQGGVEGSYGRDSQGNERTPSPKACAPQAVHPCP
jgi:ELWxxDGT repeat protein